MNPNDSQHFKKLSEKYPHISDKLKLFWGKPGFAEVANSFMMDTRGDTRKGFPFDDMMLLLDVMQDHDIAFPHLRVVTTFNGIEIDSMRHK